MTVKMDLSPSDVHVDGAVKAAKPLKKAKIPPAPKPRRIGKGKGLRMRIHPGGMVDVRHMNDGSTVCHSFQEILAADATGAGPVWVQIAKPGKFEGHKAGSFEMNTAVFADIVRNFTDVDLGQVAFDFEHASEMPATEGSIPEAGAPAQGWVRRLEVRNGSLWGLVDWLEPARTYIKEKKYRYLSPAIRFGARHPETGQPIGARLTSVALTNRPFLRGMMPLVASDAGAAGEDLVTMRYAHSTDEYMPRIRTALRLSELCTARECSDAMARLMGAYKAGGGAMYQGVDVPAYVSAMRDMVGAPLGSTVEEILEAVKALIEAALEEHEATLHSDHEGDDEVAEMMDTITGGEDVVAAASDKQTTATELVTPPTGALTMEINKELEAAHAEKATLMSEKAVLNTANAELTLKLKDAESKVSTLEGEVKSLRDWKGEREASDLKSEVDTAFETYKDAKKLSDKDREHMLVLCKAAPESFRAMYPKVEPSKRHLLRDLVKSEPTSPATFSDEKTMTIVTLAEELRSKDSKLSLEDSLLMADRQLRERARKLA
jgi:hypothetical protein